MKKQIGVWIDHRKAVVVTLQEGRDTTREIPSNVAPRVKLSGGTRSREPWGPQNITSEPRRERKHALELKRYFHDVCEHLRGADELLIFGPGDAKRELCDAMSGTGDLANRIAAVEPAEKMTDRQITARVRAHFGAAKRIRRPPTAAVSR